MSTIKLYRHPLSGHAHRVQRFLSVAAGPVASGAATARLINVFGAKLDRSKAVETAKNLFTILDKHLTGQQWLVEDTPTIADLANYTYIAHAPEGDVSLEEYPNIILWLQRIEDLPGFVPMQVTKVGLVA